jgi:hypothetical protein
MPLHTRPPKPCALTRRTLAPSLAIILLASAAVMWRILFGGHSLSGGDLVNQYIPYKALIVEQIRAGEFPHWNPMTFCGRPLQGDIQVGVFYPPNAIFLILNPIRAFDWLTFFHFVWLGWGALLFFRRILRDGAAALIAASVLTFSGFFSAQLLSGIVLFIFTGAWLPWMLWACDRGLSEKKIGPWLSLGAFGALQLLAGAPQIAYMSWVLVGLYAFVGVIAQHRTGTKNEYKAPFGIALQGWGKWIALGAAAALTAALTAVQWAPTKEFLSLSFDRGAGASWEFVTDGSLEFSWLPTFLAPFVFQHPQAIFADKIADMIYWGSSVKGVPVGYWEFNGYAGILTIALAFAGFFSLSSQAEKTDQRLAIFALLCVAAWAAFAPGRSSPLFKLAFWIVPGFDRFRVPARWVLAYQLGIALLAGLGWKKLRTLETRWPRNCAVSILAIFAVCGIALIAFRSQAVSALLGAKGFAQLVHAAGFDQGALSQLRLHEAAFLESAAIFTASAFLFLIALLALRKRRFGKAVSACAAAAILLETGWFGSSMVQSVPAKEFDERFYAQTEARAEVATMLNSDLGERFTWDESVFEWIVDQNLLEMYPNRPILYGLPTPRGYDPVNSRRYGQFCNLIAGIDSNEPPRAFMWMPQPAYPELLSLLNVRSILSYRDLSPAGYEISKSFSFMTDEMTGPGRPVEMKAYRNAEPIGPAFLARPVVLSEQEMEDPIYAFMPRLMGDFDWRKNALVEQPPPELNWPAEGFDIEPSLEILEKGYGYWKFRAATPEVCVLVLSQSYYPGWRAVVDGVEQKAMPADWALTGVYLTPGEHEALFRYRPESFDWGAKISLIALFVFVVASACVCVAGMLNRRRANVG